LAQLEPNSDLTWKGIEAFREAEEERTYERMPFDWAMTQLCLGHALALQGGSLGNEGLLEQALVAFRNALKVFTPANAPRLHSDAQRGLRFRRLVEDLRSSRLGSRRGKTS
jgi:hypothetical protein